MNDFESSSLMGSLDSAEKIIGAAILTHHDCVIHWLPAPATHPMVLAAVRHSGRHADDHQPGFMTSNGRFLDRSEAFYIAAGARQLKNTKGKFVGRELYTEDLAW